MGGIERGMGYIWPPLCQEGVTGTKKKKERREKARCCGGECVLP